MIHCVYKLVVVCHVVLRIFVYYVCNICVGSLFFQVSVIECSGHVDSEHSIHSQDFLASNAKCSCSK